MPATELYWHLGSALMLARFPVITTDIRILLKSNNNENDNSTLYGSSPRKSPARIVRWHVAPLGLPAKKMALAPVAHQGSTERRSAPGVDSRQMAVVDSLQVGYFESAETSGCHARKVLGIRVKQLMASYSFALFWRNSENEEKRG